MREPFAPVIRWDRVLLDQIAGRWMLLILGTLWDRNGLARFNELERAIPGISKKALTQGLRQLERSGLIDRKVIPGPPIRTEYTFTPLGCTLAEPVAALCKWTAKHSQAVRAAQKRYDEHNKTAAG